MSGEKYKYLDKYEREIIIFLDSLGTDVSTRTIAKSLNIHWTTTKKKLRDLEDKEVVKKVVMGNRVLWKLNKT